MSVSITTPPPAQRPATTQAAAGKTAVAAAQATQAVEQAAVAEEPEQPAGEKQLPSVQVRNSATFNGMTTQAVWARLDTLKEPQGTRPRSNAVSFEMPPVPMPQITAKPAQSANPGHTILSKLKQFASLFTRTPKSSTAKPVVKSAAKAAAKPAAQGATASTGAAKSAPVNKANDAHEALQAQLREMIRLEHEERAVAGKVELRAIMSVRDKQPADEGAVEALRAPVWSSDWNERVAYSENIHGVMDMVVQEHGVDHMGVMRKCWNFVKTGEPADLLAIKPEELNVISDSITALRELQGKVRKGETIDKRNARELATSIAGQTWSMLGNGGPVGKAELAAPRKSEG